jgi:hypothetical protein
MARIGQGIALGRQGDRVAAPALFSEVWEQIGSGGDAFYRCALAHSMADVQDDPTDELLWDLRALEAADDVTDERLTSAGIAGSVSDFYPSLHLNLGEVYRKLGNREKAREHLERSRAAVGTLGDNDYGKMISEALGRLAGRIQDDQDDVLPTNGARAADGGPPDWLKDFLL